MEKSTHGGAGRGQGRHPLPEDKKMVSRLIDLPSSMWDDLDRAAGSQSKNRNAYIRDVLQTSLNVDLQKGTGLPMIQHYARSIDDGAGRQNVTIVDGIITKQGLVARQGYYTGDGNPELVGKPKNAMHGMGFRKVAGPQTWNSFASKWQSVTEEEAIFDYEEE